ncbi:hypothetical protein Ddc_16254 [Ditylenchus destructor]|nr:hypothetical protein Ddc_16254 [Ditylenchus destructor]
MLRLVYICPALSSVASVNAVVAYCKRISPGFIIALTLNGISSFGWIVALGWLIVSWSASCGYLAKLHASDFFFTFLAFMMYMIIAAMFEWKLYLAYLDSKDEAHSSNAVDNP